MERKEEVSLFDLPGRLAQKAFEEEEQDERCCLIHTGEGSPGPMRITLEFYKRLLYCPNKKDTSVFDRERYYHPEDDPDQGSGNQELPTVQQLTAIRKIVVILCHGGYFSAAVFDGKAVKAHRTFHHYVTRKKQGGRQSTRDKTGHRPKSGGASIRRHNEQKHGNEIRKLFQDWKSHLDAAELIFTHIPGRNRSDFFGDEDARGCVVDGTLVKTAKGAYLFQKADERVRPIPFSAGRPNYTRVRQAFVKLTTIEVTTCQGDGDEAEDVELGASLRSSTDFVQIMSDDEEDEEDEEEGEEEAEEEEEEDAYY